MRQLMFVLMSVLLITACSSNEDTSDLKLNKGEKWKVNEEMKPHIEKGNQILNDYVAADGDDYKTLAADLESQNSSLIKSCTMTGESHDELHKWLHPHIDLIKNLADANDATAAAAIVKQLEESFDIYHNYFE